MIQNLYDNLAPLASMEIKVNEHFWESQWKGLLDRMEADEVMFQMCQGHPKIRAYTKWLNALEREDPPRTDFLKCLEVTWFINDLIKYKSDPEAFEEKDYWATPVEFLLSQGDCEDYCITKFCTLLYLGVPAKKLRNVIVRDTKRNIVHAVLIYTDDDNNRWIMDNLFDHCAPEQYMLKYEPIYSFDLVSQWVHVVTPKIRAGFVERYLA